MFNLSSLCTIFMCMKHFKVNVYYLIVINKINNFHFKPQYLKYQYQQCVAKGGQAITILPYYIKYYFILYLIKN